jgi:hypothetical protein
MKKFVVLVAIILFFPSILFGQKPLPTDNLIKSTEDAKAWRKYHTERVAYLQTHADLPKEALAKALHGQELGSGTIDF